MTTPTDARPTQDPSAGDAPPQEKPAAAKFQQPIHAPAIRSGFHFWKIVVMSLLVFGFAGCAFLYDGYVRYPRENARIAELDAEIAALDKPGADEAILAPLQRERKELSSHSATSLTIQRLIGIVCTPLGLWMLWRHLRTVRGAYVLADDTLALPDGRQIPIASITGVKDAKWEAKAIATFDYRKPDGTADKFVLDALAFDTKPTDAIHDEILAKMAPNPQHSA